MKKKFSMKHFLAFVLVISLALGVTGFLISGMEFSDALFNTLIMYVMNYTDSPANELINTARYLAALFTLSAIATFLLKVVGATTDIIRSWRKNSTFIFGDGSYADSYSATAKCPQIRKKTFFPAKRYVLLAENDKDNLAFYSENYEKLKEKEVYAKIGDFSSTVTMNGKHVFFSVEEMIARTYWQEQDLLSEAFPGNEISPKLSLVIPFWGDQAEQLVYYGIQNNIFDAGQAVEYHLYGCSKEYICNHKNLDRMHIYAHLEQWYEAPDELLNGATRVIICDADDRISEIVRVISRIDSGRIDLIVGMDIPKELLESASRNDPQAGKVQINVFNRIGSICNEQVLMSDWLEKAKKLNAAYLQEQGDDNGKTVQEMWAELNSFLRYSNIFAVEYHEMCKKILKAGGLTIQKAIGDPEELERMGELEHIRWCNYHFYNNWSAWECDSFEKPLKCPEKRLHKDLVPYAGLPEAEKDKDKTNIITLERLYDN